MSDSLSKLDAAKRQLVTSIRLFFDDRDAVSIHTLATNAWEIIDILCKNRDIDSLSNDARSNIKGKKSLKQDFINQPFRNFFKHADKDPNGKVEGFSDEQNDHVLFLAVEDLLRLKQKMPLECQVFQLWYLAVYDEKISTNGVDRVMAKISEVFPGIKHRSRSEQKKMGLICLHEASRNKDVIDDPRTDDSDEITRWR